jgi:methionyl aminopeptidase
MTLSHTAKFVRAGMTTNDVDRIVHDFIISHDAYPTPIGFMGFPKSVCTSVNEVVCHGIPSLRPLENGDYLNIDVTLYKEGVHGDSSIMVKIGDIDPQIQNLIDAT